MPRGSGACKAELPDWVLFYRPDCLNAQATPLYGVPSVGRQVPQPRVGWPGAVGTRMRRGRLVWFPVRFA